MSQPGFSKIEKRDRICKPNSVISGSCRTRQPLLWTTPYDVVLASYPQAHSTEAEIRRTTVMLAAWNCSGRGLPGCTVTGTPVVFYTAISPLSQRQAPGRYIFCCTFRRPDFSIETPSVRAGGTLSCGVRTFLPDLKIGAAAQFDPIFKELYSG